MFLSFHSMNFALVAINCRTFSFTLKMHMIITSNSLSSFPAVSSFPQRLNFRTIFFPLVFRQFRMNQDESLVCAFVSRLLFRSSLFCFGAGLDRLHMKVGNIKIFLYVVNQYHHYVPFALSQFHKILNRRFKIYETLRTG